MLKQALRRLIAVTSTGFVVQTALAADPRIQAAGAQPVALDAADELAVQVALRAAPQGVHVSATVMAPRPGGHMRMLRQGTNGLTCTANHPATPGVGAVCMDKWGLVSHSRSASASVAYREGFEPQLSVSAIQPTR